jgi:hypothetical protein
LLATLRNLRSACVVVWCCLRTSVDEAAAEAIAHHLARLRATDGGAASPTFTAWPAP